MRDNKVLIQDLKSRNGTHVNEKKLPADKAKILKGGDEIRIGKLKFEVLIEHGLQAPKKPQVADVDDAAARTVEAGADSKFEEVDVTSWLDEADQIDRVRKLSDPDTRQFQIEDTKQRAENSPESGDSTELSVDDSKALTKKQLLEAKKAKKTPGKLPQGAMNQSKDSSRDAADDALKKFFSGR